MQIFLNGNAHEFAPNLTLATLLELTGYTNRRVAVEVNRNIVPRSGYSTMTLNAGDKVEIVQAIGGG